MYLSLPVLSFVHYNMSTENETAMRSHTLALLGLNRDKEAAVGWLNFRVAYCNLDMARILEKKEESDR